MLILLFVLVAVGLAGQAEWARRRMDWQFATLGTAARLHEQAIRAALEDDLGTRLDLIHRALLTGVAPLAGMTDLRAVQADLEGHVTNLVTTKLDTLQQALLKPAPWWAPPAWDQGKATPVNQRLVHLVLMDADEREVHETTLVPIRQRPNTVMVEGRRYRCSGGSAAEGYFLYRLEAR